MIGIGVGPSFAQTPIVSGPVLTATVTPSSRPWLGSAEDWSTGSFLCTVSNATGTPTFLWEIVNNAGAEILIDAETASNTTLTSVEVAKPAGATIRCMVTDDLGSVYSNTVTAT